MAQDSLFSPFTSPLILAAAQAQDHIGWTNVLLGQLAIDWTLLQHAHLTSTMSHRMASSWAIGMVTHLLAISHSLWVFCNRLVHDRTVDGLAQALELQVSEELHHQFALGHQDLPASEQHYINEHSVNSLLQAPLMDQQWWLAHVALACQVGHQRHLAGIQGMQAGLHTFLHPPAPLES